MSYPYDPLANSALRQMMEELENSYSMRRAREIEELSINRYLGRYYQNSDWVFNQIHEEQRRGNRLPENLSIWNATEEFRRSSAVQELARISCLARDSGVNEMLQRFAIDASPLSVEVATLLEPYRVLSSPAIDWQTTLESRLNRLDIRWLGSDTAASVMGFAHIARLNDSIRFDHPFAHAIGDLFAEEFGEPIDEEGAPEEREKAAVSNGFNPGLIAFPSSTYDGVIVAAGFRFKLAKIPVPPAIEDADPEATYDPIHNEILNQVEQRLRQLIMSELDKLEGGTKRHIPGDVLKRWKQRQQEDRDLRRPVYEPIQYADFMDIADVISQRIAWESTFRAIFLQREDLVISLRRLHPIRKALAHGRPIGRADTLTLVSEAARILKALGLELFE